MKFRQIITALTALIFIGTPFAAAANNNNMLEPYTLKKEKYYSVNQNALLMR